MSIPSPPAYEYVNELSIPKDFFCSICLKPWVVPHETQCEHVFCYTCIYPIITSQKSCPICRTTTNLTDLRRVTRVLREQVDSFPVYCLNKMHGCLWEGPRGEHESHAAVCPNRPFVPVHNPIPVDPAPREPSDFFEEPVKKPITPPPVSAFLAPKMTVVTEYDDYAYGQSHNVLGVVHIEAPELPLSGSSRRKPISVAAVLDKSGSMAGSKLALLKETMEFVVQELNDEDELSILTYNDFVKESLSLTRMNAAGKTAALSAISSINVDGSTNISGGVFAGIDSLAGKFESAEYGIPVQTLDDLFAPSAALPQPFILEISNDYTPFKRDGTMLHRYSVRLRSDALHAVKAASLSSGEFFAKSPSCSTEMFVGIVLPEKIHSIEVKVEFAPQFNIPNATYMHPMCEVRADSIQEIMVLNKPASQTPLTSSSKGLKSTNVIKSVWLFTDGQANRGIRNPDEMKVAVQNRLSKQGVEASIFSFGFGSDHNKDLLNSISSPTGGMYYFLKNTAEIKECFADCLGGLVSVVAQNINLSINVPSGVTLKRLMTKYEHEVRNDSATIKMKDLYSQETRDFMFELAITGLPSESLAYPILKVTFDSTSVLSGTRSNDVKTCTIKRSSEVSFDQKVNVLVDEQRNRIQVEEALHKADEEARKGNYGQAAQTLQNIHHTVNASPSIHTPYCRDLVAQIATTVPLMRDASTYQSTGQYVVTQQMEAHAQQRCAHSSTGPGFYSNHSKDVFREKASKK